MNARSSRRFGGVAEQGWSFRPISVTSARSRVRDAKRKTELPEPRPSAAVQSACRIASRWTRRSCAPVRLAPSRRLREEVITVHDLPPLRFRDEGTLTRAAAAGARCASRIITPSRFAQREISSLLGIDEVDIDVIPYGISLEYLTGDPASDMELAELGICVPFILPGRRRSHRAEESRRAIGGLEAAGLSASKPVSRPLRPS